MFYMKNIHKLYKGFLGLASNIIKVQSIRVSYNVLREKYSQTL